MKQFGAWLVLAVVVGCSKSQPPTGAAASAAAALPSVPSAQPPTGAAASTAPTAPTAASAASAPSAAPSSFKGGNKETIGDAVGLGCEATSLDGWLQFLCRKKNGTGGHPVRALIHGGPAPEQAGNEPGSEPNAADAGEGEELSANEQGELNLVLPFSGEAKRDVVIEWTDTSYTLHVTGPKATLEWVGSGVPHRRACQRLLDESKAAQVAAQKLDGEARLTPSESSKLGHFGVCRPAGHGSWALGLKSASGKGEGATRLHHLELEVVRIDVDGKRQSASFGNFDLAPGALELGALQVYDYDDDGRDELIVPYEIKASLPGSTPTFVSPIWSFNDTSVLAYAKAPSVNGGIGVEQLDFDMRPDFGTYAGFVAWLGADCGLKTCPTRITGPKLYLHSQPDGGFTDGDDAAASALKRSSCSNKPANIVVEAGGALNATQTARNLICAKAWGVAPDAIRAELSNKHGALCGEAATCPLQSSFNAWAELPLPVALAQKP